MPELPEVEIIRQGLANHIVGKKIAEVSVRSSKIFQGDEKSIIGAKIISIERRAKMILIDLDNDRSLLIHLKMTGQLVFDKSPNDKSTRTVGGHPSRDWVADLPNQFTHVIVHFIDGSILYFNDLRKFGYIKLYDTKEINSLKVLKELGPEPFSEKLTPEYLMAICAKRPRVKIKQILMDQTAISGIGNIYADESLFCAGISPLRPAGCLAKSELMRLINCIIKVLNKGLKYGGSSENTFVNVEGGRGQMQGHFRVYRKTGSICPRGCGKVVRTVVGGRGTHYCPICQK